MGCSLCTATGTSIPKKQDHRGITNITKYTLGFKSFQVAEATISGIELHRMLKKEQMENAGDTQLGSSFMSLRPVRNR